MLKQNWKKSQGRKISSIWPKISAKQEKGTQRIMKF